MKADLTRDTFNPAKHYSRVMMQQGRVAVDADWNEQASILLYQMRTTFADIIGPYGGPLNNCGFQLSSTGIGDLSLAPGHYYVDGILVEIDASTEYASQPYWTPPSTDAVMNELAQTTATTNVYWLYLDVWEWHLTYISDNNIREVALNGPDTCTRTEVVWQVKSLLSANTLNGDGNFNQENPETCSTPLQGLMSVSTGQMVAQVDPGMSTSDPCITPPSASYRGTENQLYRVEVHVGGTAGTATFKWSRDNGSIATALVSQSGNVLTVSLTRGFEAGNWIELLDDNMELSQTPGTLVKLSQAGNGTLTVDPNSLPSGVTLDTIYGGLSQDANPRAICWDQTDTDAAPLTNGAVPIAESPATNLSWIDLEDGVQVAFVQAMNNVANQYRTGDYWLIPARVATASIEWPTSTDPSSGDESPMAMPPNGVVHHFAPLGFVTWAGGSFQWSGCLCLFNQLARCGGEFVQEPPRQVSYPAEYQAEQVAQEKVVEEKMARTQVVRRQQRAQKASKP